MTTEKPPAARDSDTSVAAAESMESSAASLRAQILALLRATPSGLTTDEVEVITGLAHQTASPRMWELHKRGLIGDSGKRRKTRSGRLAAVYRALTDEEIAQLSDTVAEETKKEAEKTIKRAEETNTAVQKLLELSNQSTSKRDAARIDLTSLLGGKGKA